MICGGVEVSKLCDYAGHTKSLWYMGNVLSILLLNGGQSSMNSSLPLNCKGTSDRGWVGDEEVQLVSSHSFSFQAEIPTDTVCIP